MRILHIVPTYYPATYWGGPIFSTYYLNNELAKLPDVKLEVLTTDSAGPQKKLVIDKEKLRTTIFPNYKVYFTKRIFGKSLSLEMFWRMFSMIQEADIVHLTGVYSPPTLPTLFLSRILKKPLVWSPRGAILEAFEWKNARKRKFKKLWDQICNILIVPGKVMLHVTSDEEERTSLARLPKAQAVNIRNGVFVKDRLEERNRCPDGKARLLFIGRLHPKKGIENLLEAIRLLGDPAITLKLYGTGDEKYVDSLKQYAKELNLLEKVFFMGHVDDVEKERAFVDADFCIVPSHSENFGIVVVEALSYGLPVIASTFTPWKKLEEKKCGLWVKNDLVSLAQAIMKIRSMDIEEMGKNGWLWMKEEFDWEKIAQKTYRAYQKSLKGNCHD